MRARCLVGACLFFSTVEFIGNPSGAAADDPAEVVLSAAIRAGAARPVAESWIRAEASRLAKGLSAEQRQKLADDAEFASGLVSPRPRRRAVSEDLRGLAPTPESLGDTASDLVFVPIAPCRVIDTRIAVAGILLGSSSRSFRIAGAALDSQGGEAAGCGVPLGIGTPAASAVAINFVAVSPQGDGNLRAWEFGQPMPNASVINYTNGPTIANGVIVPITGLTAQAFDLTVSADVSSTHLVADVTGYFTRAAVERVKSTLDVSDSVVTGALADGECIEVASCTVTAAAAGRVMVTVSGRYSISHTSGTRDIMFHTIETANPVVCAFPPGVYSTDTVGPLLPDDDYSGSLSWSRYFPVAMGSTTTFRYAARMLSGAGTNDYVSGVRIFCLYVPE